MSNFSSLKKINPVNLYRAIQTMRNGLRRQVPVETQNEDRQHLNGFDRLTAIAMGRDLNRNSSKAITILNQRSVLTVGEVKAQFNSIDPEWNKTANRYFNGTFARDCYYKHPEHLAQIANWVELALIREGDILVVFDDFLTGSGKLLLWEADQLVTVDPGDWAKQQEFVDNIGGKMTPMFQENGVIQNVFGKVVAYAVTRQNIADQQKRGQMTCRIDDVTFIPAENARLVRHTFRPGQVRGVPVILPVSDDLEDIEEMIKSELCTAKIRSKLMAFVKQSKDSLDELEQETTLRAIAERGGWEDLDREVKVVEKRRYRIAEDALGGNVEYGDPGEDLTFPGIDRPNLDTATFFNFLGDSAGATLGLAQGYSRMAVSSSYTAHRGETCLTFRHILRQQKKHEHDWLDWLAVKVIQFAVQKGELPAGPEGWQQEVSWRMPSPDVIDPQKEAAADLQNMKNGKKNLLDIVGPDWKEKLDQTAEILKYARGKEIPLAMFETVAGAAAEIPNHEEDEEENAI